MGQEIWTRKCLEELAGLDYRGERISFPWEEFWRVAHCLGSVCICMCTDQERSLEEVAEQLGRSRVRYLAGEKISGEISEYECLYGEEFCRDPGIYLAAEKEVPKEIRIGPLYGSGEEEERKGEDRENQTREEKGEETKEGKTGEGKGEKSGKDKAGEGKGEKSGEDKAGEGKEKKSRENQAGERQKEKDREKL